MCNDFSGVIERSRRVYWLAGLSSHHKIIEHFKLDDTRNDGSLCPFEIVPKNGDYLNPNEWQFNFDMSVPEWWKKSHELACWEAFKQWKKEVYSKINIEEARNPINPLRIKAPATIDETHLKLLREWASVWDSVGASIEASVISSVEASVWTSVRSSVGAEVWTLVKASVFWASVGVSVRASVWAYIGSLFTLKRDEWKYTENIKTDVYPFQPLVELWKQGFMPSFDGNIWRLHAGKKADIVLEISQEDLKAKSL